MKIKIFDDKAPKEQLSIALLISSEELLYITSCLGMTNVENAIDHRFEAGTYRHWEKESINKDNLKSVFNQLKDALLTVVPNPTGEK